jgi:hypothetical protein
MMRRSLEERIRERKSAEAEAAAAPDRPSPPSPPEPPKLWPVPVDAIEPADRLVGALMLARRVVNDPLETQASALLAQVEQAPTWYQTKAASKVASDLQQSPALNMIYHAVEMAESHHEDPNKELQRNIEEMVAQGQSLINRLQRYEADFWNPDLRDLAGRVLRIIHPDSRDQRMAVRFTAEMLRDTYSRALAARNGMRTASTGYFVRDAERILVWQIRTWLIDGKSLRQIAEEHPGIAQDLELIQWLRHVKARQVDVADQLVKGRKRQEDHAQGHVESFSVIIGTLDAITTYAGMAEYPCRNQVAMLQGHLQEVERLTEQLPDIERFPMAKYKADQLQLAIQDLVAPVVRLATVVRTERASSGPGSSRFNALNAALTGLSTVLEFADSAARSYIEWLEERVAAKTTGLFKQVSFRPAAW